MSGKTWAMPEARGVCMCGCGQSTPLATDTRNGNVKGQPTRYVPTHNNSVQLTPEQVETRFWQKVDKSGECWLWTGSRDVAGYGTHFIGGGRRRQAHRSAYLYEVGEVPAGLVLDHLCRNRPCVRPDHLEAVTHRENILRGVGASATNAKRTKCINGHDLPERTGVRRVCKRCRADRARLKRAQAKGTAA